MEDAQMINVEQCKRPLSEAESYDDDDGTPPGKRRRMTWTEKEDRQIIDSVRRLGTQWDRIADAMPGRTADAVRNRCHRLHKTMALYMTVVPPSEAVDTDAFSDDERKTGSAHGRSKWTSEEDRLIRDGVQRFGCKWRQIAAMLPGRSDSSVRNRWTRQQPSARSVHTASRQYGVKQYSEQLEQLPPLTAAKGPACSFQLLPITTGVPITMGHVISPQLPARAAAAAAAAMQSPVCKHDYYYAAAPPLPLSATCSPRVEPLPITRPPPLQQQPRAPLSVLQCTSAPPPAEAPAVEQLTVDVASCTDIGSSTDISPLYDFDLSQFDRVPHPADLLIHRPVSPLR